MVDKHPYVRATYIRRNRGERKFRDKIFLDDLIVQWEKLSSLTMPVLAICTVLRPERL